MAKVIDGVVVPENDIDIKLLANIILKGFGEYTTLAYKGEGMFETAESKGKEAVFLGHTKDRKLLVIIEHRQP
jgi:uncharacterized protein YjiK